MRVTRFALEDFAVPLRRPLHTAHGEIGERRGVGVRLYDEAGHCGRGESAPLAGFGLESLEEARAALARGAKAICADCADLDAALDRLEAPTEKAPSARGALDTALHDLAAQRAGLGLADFLARIEGRRARARVSFASLLREREPAALRDEARAALAAGCGALKLKIAAGGDDLARVAALREVCPPEVELRLDANAAWSETRARSALAELAGFAPSYVEQPVADVEALARLRETGPVPIAVDESLCDERAAERIAACAAADVWVLKPAVVGGLRTARRIAAIGRAAGADVVVGGFLDGPIGSAAARGLAAALPGERPAGLEPAA